MLSDLPSLLMSKLQSWNWVLFCWLLIPWRLHSPSWNKNYSIPEGLKLFQHNSHSISKPKSKCVYISIRAGIWKGVSSTCLFQTVKFWTQLFSLISRKQVAWLPSALSPWVVSGQLLVLLLQTTGRKCIMTALFTEPLLWGRLCVGCFFLPSF